MVLEKEKKRKRRFTLVAALIAVLLATVLWYWYTHQTGREKYSVYIEDGICNVTVTETLPSKLDIYIDSRAEPYVNYIVWVKKNITFHVTEELESNPKIGFEQKESSILYWIRLENCSFSWAMITFLCTSTGDYLLTIEIERAREHFTSFFMQFETYKEEG